MYRYAAKLLKVVDGDTIVIEIDLGFDLTIRQTVRLFGINAPEIHSKNPAEKIIGLRAKDRLAEMLGHGTIPFEVETVSANDKYGRYLAKIISGGVNINQKMVDEKLAWVYDGKTKVGTLEDLINDRT